MKIIALILSCILVAAPCLADAGMLPDGLLVASASDEQPEQKPSGEKVVIKGKGGKVTDVDKKPKEDGRGKKDEKDGKQ